MYTIGPIALLDVTCKPNKQLTRRLVSLVLVRECRINLTLWDNGSILELTKYLEAYSCIDCDRSVAASLIQNNRGC